MSRNSREGWYSGTHYNSYNGFLSNCEDKVRRHSRTHVKRFALRNYY